MTDTTRVGYLNKSDVVTGVVGAVQAYIESTQYSSRNSILWAGVAPTVISAMSRALTEYGWGLGFGGSDSYLPVTEGTGLKPATTNILYVGVFNAVLAYLARQNIPKNILRGIGIDSLGYAVMQNLPGMAAEDSIIFGNYSK